MLILLRMFCLSDLNRFCMTHCSFVFESSVLFTMVKASYSDFFQWLTCAVSVHCWPPVVICSVCKSKSTTVQFGSVSLFCAVFCHDKDFISRSRSSIYCVSWSCDKAACFPALVNSFLLNVDHIGTGHTGNSTRFSVISDCRTFVLLIRMCDCFFFPYFWQHCLNGRNMKLSHKVFSKYLFDKKFPKDSRTQWEILSCLWGILA